MPAHLRSLLEIRYLIFILSEAVLKDDAIYVSDRTLLLID